MSNVSWTKVPHYNSFWNDDKTKEMSCRIQYFSENIIQLHLFCCGCERLFQFWQIPSLLSMSSKQSTREWRFLLVLAWLPRQIFFFHPPLADCTKSADFNSFFFPFFRIPSWREKSKLLFCSHKHTRVFFISRRKDSLTCFVIITQTSLALCGATEDTEKTKTTHHWKSFPPK